MATLDPSEDEISQVIDFAGLDPHEDRLMVINALKNNSRNVESVVMQYFDNPETFRQKFVTAWNDAMFSADRDGSTTSTGISFHIESLNQSDAIQGVTPPPPGYVAGAPSRPPSRSNNRSPLGRMTDWAVGEASGGAIIHSQEDDDMQRALRESAKEAGIVIPQQETGIMDVSTSTPYFGPANRTDYDQGSWAMVPVGTSETKIANGPTPSQRKRAAGAPAFLVQGISPAGTHRLGGLLSILHEIPLARNILLDCGSPAASYGYNSEWWNGQEILPPHVVNQLQTGELRWGQQDEQKPDFEEEIHRLMAFLDSTERSYGTVSVLTDLTPYASVGVEKQFYELLGQRNGTKLEPLCQVATLASLHGDDLGSEEAKFGLLDLEHLRTDYTNIKTLYESLDHLMWSDVLSWNEAHEGSKMAMFKDMGEILAIKIGNEGPPDGIDIPAELYPEKYLASRKEEARRIQLAWCETKNAMARVQQEEQGLQEWQNDWNQQAFNKREMVEKVRDQWKTFSDYLDSAGRFQSMESSGFDTNKYPDYRAAPCQMTDEQQKHSEEVEEMIRLAERVLSDMAARTEDLRSQLEQIQAKQRFLGRLLTVPEKPGRPKPMTCKKYLLRGVATDKDVIYICQRIEADLAESESRNEPVDQWWRLAYSPKEDQPVKSEKIEIERVLRDVWDDTKTPLLVYATEESLKTPRAPLSESLERFARSENRAFRQELSQEMSNTGEERGRGSVDPISPSKRKHRADSMDSMNSNRASIGSDDRNSFESPFGDQAESAETELTDMSGRSEIARVADGDSKAGEASKAPPLPGRDAAAHMDTLAAEENSAPRAVPLESSQDGDESQGPVQESIETRSPEMQERARPPTFMTMPSGERRHSTMDMEISDHQE